MSLAPRTAPSVNAAVRTTGFMRSVAFDHVVVGLVAIGRRFAVHPNTETPLLAATPPIDTAALLLKPRQVGRELVAPCAQHRDLGGRRQRPARDADRTQGT